jgi:hypothetical protein
VGSAPGPGSCPSTPWSAGDDTIETNQRRTGHRQINLASQLAEMNFSTKLEGGRLSSRLLVLAEQRFGSDDRLPVANAKPEWRGCGGGVGCFPN